MQGDGWSASVDLPFTAQAPAAAREVLRGLLIAWGREQQADDAAVVVVSELVTNAVQHAGEQGQLHLSLAAREGVLRLELADGSALRPVAPELSDSDERGRGMHVVDPEPDRRPTVRAVARGWPAPC
ncbi:ATP-binding protein [Frankia sp. Cas3]|uniref:ATP-binding protein n=1 Tax=Frankia sp. Cas3 TaxID=3073926 RepID=UPI002AD55261|nr:ATP-binding protein [Frankia sp. Cas3]